MSSPSSDKSPLERALETGVYVPLGFLVTRAKAVPELAAAGRKQLAFTRSLGRAALKSITRGLRGGSSPVASSQPAAPTAPEPVTPAVAEAGGDSTEVVFDGPGPAEPGDVAPVDGPRDEPVDEQGAGLEGYDTMTAKELVSFLRDCGPEQARLVHERETEGKARVTVLRAAEKAMS